MADKLGRKHDSHGHVIPNNESDGQECRHDTNGGRVEGNVKDNKFHNKNGDIQPMNDAGEVVDEVFDDDYEEEFKEPSPEDERQYVDKCMADIAKAADKKAFEYVSDNIDELTEAGLISDETSDRLMDALNKKIDEVNNDIDKDFVDAINNADDDVLDEYFDKDTLERKLVGAIKESDDEWTKRHNDFLEKGKSTWNQKLKKGDKVVFEDKEGNDTEAYIGGFYKSGELVDEDAYEEGKDNLWHDFRGVNLVDKDGKSLGNINAFQIKKHSREDNKPQMTQEQRQAIRNQRLAEEARKKDAAKKQEKETEKLPRYALERYKSGDYDLNQTIDEVLKSFPNALSALNWVISELKGKK